ncbi:MAG TPA: hypothetical protein VF303_01795 [Candidatus Nanoarchaeia archaeon]
MRLQQYGRLTDYKKVGDSVLYDVGKGDHRVMLWGTIVRFLPANGGAILRVDSLRIRGKAMEGYEEGTEISAGSHEIDV